MNQGGIFSGPTALGAAASDVACNSTNTALVRKVQSYLKANGAPNLKIDGAWQGCTASAFRKIFGRPYVTADDIYKMTGETCKSASTFLAGIIPDFTIPSVNVCNDGSDGVPAGGGGGGTAPAQQCPSGSCWNDVLRTCVPDPFGLLCPSGGSTGTPAPTTQQTQCPQGQAWNDFLKMCLPSFTTPVSSPPSKCPQGSVQLPDGTCLGGGGITQPTECPEGQIKVGGSCVPAPAGSQDLLSTISSTIGSIFGQGPAQPTQPGQPAAQGGGLQDIINGITGAIGNLFGASSGCAPGLVFNPATGQCVGPGGVSVPPGWTNPTTPSTPPSTSVESPWGSMGYVIAGVVGIGAVAAVGIWAVNKKKTNSLLFDMSGQLTQDELDLLNAEVEQELAAEFGESPGLGVPFDMGYQANRRRRRRRRSRRRGRRRRRWSRR